MRCLLVLLVAVATLALPAAAGPGWHAVPCEATPGRTDEGAAVLLTLTPAPDRVCRCLVYYGKKPVCACAEAI